MTIGLHQVIQLFLLLATVIVVFAPRLVFSLLGLSVFSMFLALKYYVLNAPDVAITEAALGTGLTTIVFLVAIQKTKRRS